MNDMRRLITLVESALDPRPGGMRYYHGTPSRDWANRIWQDGLQPQTQDNTHLSGVAGHVYLTPDIGYAQIYAMGARFDGMGSERFRIPYQGNESKFQWVIKEGGRYGYVFVVPEDQLVASKPDEDDIGILYCLAKGAGEFFWETWNHALIHRAEQDPTMLERFVAYMEAAVSPATRKQMLADRNSLSSIQWASKGGKIALKKMPPDLRAWLLSVGCHVAHEGAVIPTECWELDKTKIGWLQKDGSTFFEIAKKVASR